MSSVAGFRCEIQRYPIYRMDEETGEELLDERESFTVFSTIYVSANTVVRAVIYNATGREATALEPVWYVEWRWPAARATCRITDDSPQRRALAIGQVAATVLESARSNIPSGAIDAAHFLATLAATVPGSSWEKAGQRGR